MRNLNVGLFERAEEIACSACMQQALFGLLTNTYNLHIIEHVTIQ
jgi:hypothetical protein